MIYIVWILDLIDCRCQLVYLSYFLLLNFNHLDLNLFLDSCLRYWFMLFGSWIWLSQPKFDFWTSPVFWCHQQDTWETCKCCSHSWTVGQSPPQPRRKNVLRFWHLGFSEDLYLSLFVVPQKIYWPSTLGWTSPQVR